MTIANTTPQCLCERRTARCELLAEIMYHHVKALFKVSFRTPVGAIFSYSHVKTQVSSYSPFFFEFGDPEGALARLLVVMSPTHTALDARRCPEYVRFRRTGTLPSANGASEMPA